MGGGSGETSGPAKAGRHGAGRHLNVVSGFSRTTIPRRTGTGQARSRRRGGRVFCSPTPPRIGARGPGPHWLRLSEQLLFQRRCARTVRQFARGRLDWGDTADSPEDTAADARWRRDVERQIPDAVLLSSPTHEPRARHPDRFLRNRRIDRRGRHGRGLPGHRYRTRPGGRHQDPARHVRGRPRAARPLRARSADSRVPEPSQHRAGLRLSRSRARHGAPRGRDAARPAQRRHAPLAQGHRVRRADRARARRRARARHHPSRPQAGEHLPAARRAGEDSRLRSRPAGGHGRVGRHRDARRRGAHRSRHRDGHGGVHVAGAGPRRRARCPFRPVLPRRGPLRNVHGPACVPARHHGRDDDGDPPGGPAGALGRARRSQPRARSHRPALPREEPGRAVPDGEGHRLRARLAVRIGIRRRWPSPPRRRRTRANDGSGRG